MKTNKDIQKKIIETLDVVDTIDNVQVSPFFKDKTMQKLFSDEEQEQAVFTWFTPKLQLVALACVIVLNILAFSQLSVVSAEDQVGDFAETYGLSDETETEAETLLFN